MRTNARRAQAGLTLIELMVSMVVGLAVLGGATGVFISTLRSTNDNVRSLQLNEEIRAAAEVMIAEVRRAGYLYNAALYATLPANRDPTLSASRQSLVLSAGGTCITYAYDRDLDADFAEEHHGFRLGDNGAIEFWSPGADAMPDCNDDSENWRAITNPGVANVTRFEIDLGGSQCVNTDTDPPAEWSPDLSALRVNACDPAQPNYDATEGDLLVETRRVNVVIEARHNTDANIRTRFETSVRIRNDTLIVAPASPPAS